MFISDPGYGVDHTALYADAPHLALLNRILHPTNSVTAFSASYIENKYLNNATLGLTITNGLVQLGDISSIVAGCPLTINLAKITSTTGTYSKHRGVVVFGQPNDIRNSTIQYGATGVTGVLNNNTLNISNCFINNCDVGVKTFGGHLKVDGNISNNKTHGLLADGLTGASSISGVFNNNGASGPNAGCGVAVMHASADASVTFSGSASANSLYGIFFEGPKATLNMRCAATANNNNYGVYAANGAVVT